MTMAPAFVAVAPPARPAARLSRFLAAYARARGGAAAWRLAVKIAAHPQKFRRWLDELEAMRRHQAPPAPLVHALAIAPLRPFLAVGLSFDQKSAILRSHCALLAAQVPPARLSRLWSGRPLRLGVAPGRRGENFALWLSLAEFFREGALQIFIAPDCGAAEPAPPLARLTFTLAATGLTGGRRALLIGGLQGPRAENGKAAIVAATRAMRGLRPKAAVLLAAQGLAAAAGCVESRAVGNARHVVHSQGRAACAKKLADYDGFWRERGGAPDGGVGFILPGLAPGLSGARKAAADCGAAAFSDAPEFFCTPNPLDKGDI